MLKGIASNKCAIVIRTLRSLERKSFSNTKPDSNEDIISNYKPLSNTERVTSIFRSAFGAFKDPTKGDLVSTLGDTTSYYVLLNLKERMKKDATGRKLLAEKPRINRESVTFGELSSHSPNTFGHQYYTFMNSHGFHPEERPLVRHIPDYDLAYIYQRYKEIHDFLHVLLCYDVNVSSELAVKWFEMIQLEIPSAALSAFVGPLLLKPSELSSLFRKDLPRVIQNAYNCPFILNVDFENEFKTDLNDLRLKLHLEAL